MDHIELTVEIVKEKLSSGQEVYVAVCQTLDVTSQGSSIEEAKKNITEAIVLFSECATPIELERRMPAARDQEIFTTKVDLPIGKTPNFVGARCV